MQRKSTKYYICVLWGLKKMGRKRERSKWVTDNDAKTNFSETSDT